MAEPLYRKVPCDWCNGSGGFVKDCSRCEGTGHHYVPAPLTGEVVEAAVTAMRPILGDEWIRWNGGADIASRALLAIGFQEAE